MKEKCEGYNKILLNIEASIQAFITLYEFRKSQEYKPLIMQKKGSMNKLNNARLLEIDPLLGSIPQTYEDEKKLLQAKHRE